MAYIRKRGKTWSYTIDIGRDPATGERRQDTKSGFRTKRDAELSAGKAESEVAEGTFVKQTSMTFKEFGELWHSHYSTTGAVKNGSISARRVQLNKLISIFGEAKLTDITRLMYQEMLLKLKEEKYANDTMVGFHATAKMIFRRAMELQILKSDPTQYSKVPRHRRTVEEIENGNAIPKYMEKEQLAKFLEVAKREGLDKDYAVFTVLAYTGLRIGELAVLKWSDIDLNNLTIRITKTYGNVRNNTKLYTLEPPKTEAGIRVIEFDPILLEIFEKQKALVNIYKMRYRKKYYDKDFAFPNLRPKFPGYPDVQKNIEMRMIRLIELSGLPKELTPHSLRHTHTTLLAEAGAGLQETMERLGHKDDEVTRLVYMHVTREMKSSAAAKFGKLMSNVVKL